MKKIIQIIILLFLCSCTLNTNKDIFTLTQGVKGINLYQNSKKDVSIIDVDLNNAGVSFGMVNSSTGNIVIDYEKPGSKKERFYRFYPKDLKTGKNNKVFAMVNGQFFNADKKPTFLSFPVKSSGKVISSYVDNDMKKRTLIIDKNNNVKVLEGYNRQELYNDNNKELIVVLDPLVDAVRNDKVGRTYVGIRGDKNILFFVAKNKSQEEMNKILSDYGIKENDIVMMDGGPSSQFGYYDNGIKSLYGEWSVPQYNIIYTK